LLFSLTRNCTDHLARGIARRDVSQTRGKPENEIPSEILAPVLDTRNLKAVTPVIYFATCDLCDRDAFVRSCKRNFPDSQSRPRMTNEITFIWSILSRNPPCSRWRCVYICVRYSYRNHEYRLYLLSAIGV